VRRAHGRECAIGDAEGGGAEIEIAHELCELVDVGG
jgi:hypothetical protein